MAITVDGLPIGSGSVGPNTVGSLEVIDGSLGTVDLNFDPFATGSSKRAIRLVGASGPIVEGDDLILVNTSAGTVILDLPALPNDGETCEVCHWTIGNAVTVSGNGKNVNGSPSKTFSNPKQTLKFTYSLAVDEWVIG